MSTLENQAPEYAYLQAEQRKRTRIPDLTSSEVLFWTPAHGEQTARLEDVSLGGFAVTIAEASGFFAQQELIVCFKEGLARTRVKYVITDSDNGYRIGLKWVEPRSSAVTQVLERCLTEIYSKITSVPTP